MYSREKQMRAIELYITYEKGAADVIRELGYPDRKTLRVGRAPCDSCDEFSSKNGGGVGERGLGLGRP